MPTVEDRLAAVERKLRFQRAMIVGLLFTLVMLGSCKVGKDSNANRSKETAQQVEIEATVERLARQHGAILDWRRKLGDTPGLLAGSLHTIEIEDAIVRTGGRPIAFTARLFDVRRYQGSLQIIFTSDFYNPFPKMVFVLDCPLASERQFANYPSGLDRGFISFAVIARIKSVQKILLNTSVGDNEVYIQPLDDQFIATGECVDLSVASN
jgi:hypothetical protein